jgi:hypothetical protein
MAVKELMARETRRDGAEGFDDLENPILDNNFMSGVSGFQSGVSVDKVSTEDTSMSDDEEKLMSKIFAKSNRNKLISMVVVPLILMNGLIPRHIFCKNTAAPNIQNLTIAFNYLIYGCTWSFMTYIAMQIGETSRNVFDQFHLDYYSISANKISERKEIEQRLSVWKFFYMRYMWSSTFGILICCFAFFKVIIHSVLDH